MAKVKHESEARIYQAEPWARTRICMKKSTHLRSAKHLEKGTYEATKAASLLATPFKVG